MEPRRVTLRIEGQENPIKGRCRCSWGDCRGSFLSPQIGPSKGTVPQKLPPKNANTVTDAKVGWDKVRASPLKEKPNICLGGVGWGGPKPELDPMIVPLVGGEKLHHRARPLRGNKWKNRGEKLKPPHRVVPLPVPQKQTVGCPPPKHFGDLLQRG